MVNRLARGFRTGIRQPLIAVTSCVLLCAGIGAATSALAIADAVLVRSLPYPDEHQLVMLTTEPLSYSSSEVSLAPAIQQLGAFMSAGFFISSNANVGEFEQARRVPASAVDVGFFTTLGVQPWIGRVLGRQDRGRDKVVVLAYPLWRAYFGASHSVGDWLTVNGERYEVIGIMPERFVAPDGAQLWIPSLADPQFLDAAAARRVIARLRDGVSLDVASSELMRALVSEHGSEAAARLPRPLLQPLGAEEVKEIRPKLALLSVAGGLLLLAAIAGVAGIMFAGMHGRSLDLGLRRVLGARRSHLVQEVLAETGWLALAAAIGGVVLSFWIVSGASHADWLPPHVTLEWDRRTAILAAALTASTWGLLALLPVAMADDGIELAAVRGEAMHRGNPRGSSILAVAQIAIAVVLLGTAATLTATLRRQHTVDLGYRNELATVLELTVPTARYSPGAGVTALVERIEEGLRTQPDVAMVAATDTGPGTAARISTTPLTFDTAPVSTTQLRADPAQLIAVTPGYFRVLGIPLIAGREFGSRDLRGSRRVAILSEVAVRRLGLTPDTAIGRHLPLGQQIWGNVQSGPSYRAEIVGVVAPTRVTDLSGFPPAQVYEPFSQTMNTGTVSLIVEPRGTQSDVVATAQRTLADIDASIPIDRSVTIGRLTDALLYKQRVSARVLAACAAFVLLLSAGGLFGTLSHRVFLRSREFGVRQALGAAPGEITSSVLRSAAWITLQGIVAGLLLAKLGFMFARHMFPGVAAPSDADLVAAVAIVIVVSLLASVFPASKAAKLDPSVLLRRV